MKTYRNMNGFTLIEIIAILVILIIITAVTLTRITSSQNNLIAATDTLTSHLRLAQARAMNTYLPDTGAGGSVWGMNFTSSTQYSLFYCAAALPPQRSILCFIVLRPAHVTLPPVKLLSSVPAAWI